MNGGDSVQSARLPAWNGGLVPCPHRPATESASSRWAAAASVSDGRRSVFQKDRGGLATKFTAQRTRSLDHPGPSDPRHAWITQPSKKFDDTDEEVQSPMVTSHNGPTPGLLRIPPVMTSSLCSANGDEPFARSGGKYLNVNVRFIYSGRLSSKMIDSSAHHALLTF